MAVHKIGDDAEPEIGNHLLLVLTSSAAIENLLELVFRKNLAPPRAFRGEASLCEIITPAFLDRKRRMEDREAKTAFTPRLRA